MVRGPMCSTSASPGTMRASARRAWWPGTTAVASAPTANRASPWVRRPGSVAILGPLVVQVNTDQTETDQVAGNVEAAADGTAGNVKTEADSLLDIPKKEIDWLTRVPNKAADQAFRKAWARGEPLLRAPPGWDREQADQRRTDQVARNVEEPSEFDLLMLESDCEDCDQLFEGVSNSTMNSSRLSPPPRLAARSVRSWLS